MLNTLTVLRFRCWNVPSIPDFNGQRETGSFLHVSAILCQCRGHQFPALRFSAGHPSLNHLLLILKNEVEVEMSQSRRVTVLQTARSPSQTPTPSGCSGNTLPFPPTIHVIQMSLPTLFPLHLLLKPLDQV